MTEEPEQRLSLHRIGVAVGILVGAAGLFGAYVLLPYRMDAAEKRLEATDKWKETTDQKLEAYRELLVRIDENVKAMRERGK